MRALFDTNVIVASVLTEHSFHTRALAWTQKARDGNVTGYYSQHSLAEAFSALSSIPTQPRLLLEDVLSLVRDATAPLKSVALTPRDYSRVLAEQARLGLRGGAVYDALIAYSAKKSKADLLLTFNPEDFHRVWPEGGKKIHVP